jgi:hypothetical protein
MLYLVGMTCSGSQARSRPGVGEKEHDLRLGPLMFDSDPWSRRLEGLGGGIFGENCSKEMLRS